MDKKQGKNKGKKKPPPPKNREGDNIYISYSLFFGKNSTDFMT